MNSIVAKPYWLFCSIAVIFGIIFTLMAPPLWGFDETSHFTRVYQLSRGEIVPDNSIGSRHGGSMSVSYNALAYHVYGDMDDDKPGTILDRKDVNDRNGYRNFTDQKFSKEQKQSIGTATYSPVAYIGPTIGVFMARMLNFTIGHTITIARLFSLGAYIAIVWAALWILKGKKIAWLLFAVALMPVPLFQAAVLSADSMANALSLLFFALLVRILQKDTKTTNKRVLLVLLATAVLLPLVKINYIFLSFGVLLVPNEYFSTTRKALLAKFGGILLITLPGVVWSMVTKATSNTPLTMRTDGAHVVASTQMYFITHHPIGFMAACIRSVVVDGDLYLQQLISVMGWNYVVMPLFLTFMIMCGVLLAAMFAKDELLHFKRALIILNILCAIGVVSVFAALYIAFTPPGKLMVDGVQGRYFVPFLVPVMALIAILLPFDIKIRDHQAAYIFGCVSLACLAACTVCYGLVTY